MPGSDSDDRRSGSEPPGIGSMASGMLATLLDYLHARVELLALEAREARVEVLMRLVCGGAGAAFLL
ncbi:MAG: hypothetical protein KDM63_18965, partial [Verrucomicrobiae bacterium]|nr:hypothetical protein [Verrucomicrobiae bacterium]